MELFYYFIDINKPVDESHSRPGQVMVHGAYYDLMQRVNDVRQSII